MATSERYNAIKAQLQQQGGAAKQNSGQTQRSDRYEAIRAKLKQNHFVTDVDADYINSFVRDAKEFAQNAEQEYKKLNYQTAVSQGAQSKRRASMDDLTTRAGRVRTYLNANRSKLSSDSYNEVMSFLDSFEDFQTKNLNAFRNAEAYFSRWETEDAYNEFLSEQAKHQKEYQEKLNANTYALTGELSALMALKAEYDALNKKVTTLAPSQSDYAYERMSQISQQYGNLDALIAEKKAYLSDAEWVQKIAGLSGAEDFQEKSKYVSTANGQERSWVDILLGHYDSTRSGWDDPLYEYVNGNEEAGAFLSNQAAENYTEAGGLGAVFGRSTDSKTESQRMTQDEVAIFNYLYATEGKQAAHDYYYNFLQSDLNARQRAYDTKYWADYAKDDPFGSSVFSVVTSPLKGLSYIGQAGDYIAGGKIDQNAGYNQFSYSNSAIRNQVAKQIEDSGNWGKVGSFMYQTGMSMADFVMSTAVSGGNQAFALAIMGTGAAADTTIAAKDRGLTDDQAFALGTVAGAAEILMEKIGLDALFDTKLLSGNAIKYILKNALAEGGEEIGTDLINTLADVLIAQDKSQWQMAMDAYVEEGKSEKEAFGLALADKALELGLSGLGGALSGGVLGGAGTLVNGLQNKVQSNAQAVKDYGGSQADLVAKALELNPGNTFALKMKGILDSGKNLTGSQLNKLVQMNEAAVKQETPGSEAAQQDQAGEVTGGDLTDGLDNAAQGGLVLPSDGNVISDHVQQNQSNTFQQKVQQQFEQANMQQNQNTEGGAQYGNIDEGNSGPAVAQSGGGNLAAGDGLLLGGIQRYDGTGTEEQVGSLAGSSEQRRSAYADRSRATVARQNYARSLRLEKVSSLDLGLQNGTEARNIQVMPQEHWDAEMSQLADRIYNETGKSVTYVMGRIQIRGPGGAVGYARGVITGERIIVQADHLRIPMEQIADHEAYHAKADSSGGRLNDEIRRHIVEAFSEEQFRQVLDKYIVGLRGVIDVNEAQTGAEFEDAIRQIEEEIFADAYAGINAFSAGADQFTAVVNEKMDQLYMGKIRKQDNGIERPTGPPLERYSAESLDTLSLPKLENQDQKENKESTASTSSAEDGYLLAANMTEREVEAGRGLAGFIDQVNRMIDKAKRSKRKYKIGTVSKNHSDVINKIMRQIKPEFDASGYELWIDGTGASHIEDRHGEYGKQDHSMSSEEAKILIPWAAQNATNGNFIFDSKGNVKLSDRYMDREGKRAPEICLEKAVSNDTVYVSECVPDSANKRVWVTSAYIKKGSKGQMLNMESSSLQLTPEAPFDGNATTDIVTDPQQSVKDEVSNDPSVGTKEDYGLKLPEVEEISFAEGFEKFSVDDVDTKYYDALENEFQAMQRGEKERFLRERLGDEGYRKYKDDRDNKARKRKEDAALAAKGARDVKTNQRKLRLETETAKVNHEEQRRMREETVPAKAKKTLRNTVLDIFSIPDGQKAELGSMIDAYADRLIKNGRLTEKDRKTFFDRMYASGVMTVPADDYYAEVRSYMKDGRIYVPDSVVADFGDDWNDIRRRAFAARIYLTRSRVSGGYSVAGIDVWNSDLASNLPGLFDAEETDQRSILERIVQVAEEGRDEKMSLSEYTAHLAETEHRPEEEFLDSIERQLDWALRTFAASASIEIETKTEEIRKQASTRRQNLQLQATLAAERQERKDSARRAKERRELRELQQRTLKQLQWLSKNRFRAPEELQATWDEVLSDIDIYAISAADEMRWSDKHNATWKDLAQMYKDAMKNDPNFLPSKELERIVTRLDASKIADMDLGALQDLYKAAIGLRTEFYNRNNVINDEMQRLFAEVYTDAKREIESAPGGFTGGVADKFLNLDQLTPMNVLQRMAGWDPDGAFYSMAKQLERGERDMRAYSVKAQKMLQDFLTEHEDWVKKADGQGKDAIWYEVEVPQLLELGMGDKPIFGPTVKVYMTPAQKVHMYLESKNLDNLRHMTGGRTFVNKDLYSQGKRQEALSQGRTIKLAPETVRKLVSDLTPEEMELAQLLDRYYNTFATQEINKVSNILYGYDKAMGKNYAPIYTNRNYTKTEFGVFDTTAEGVGNLKGRQYAVNPSYNISAFDAFERHVDQTARFCGMAIPARNWTTLMNWREKNNSTGDVITHKWGEESKRYITDLITTLQAGDDAKADTISSGLSKLQSNYITAIFGANPGIVLKQLGSIPLAGAYLDAKNMPTPAQIAKIDRSLISKYTQELEWRTMGYATPETKQLKDNPNWTQTNKVFKFVFGGGAITAMDGWAASTLWPWAENKVRREHPELIVGTTAQVEAGESAFYKKVAEEFENAISRSQSVSDEIHQGTLRKSKNPITKAFTMFRSDSAQTYNALRQKIGEARYYMRTGAKDKVIQTAKKAVGAAFVAMLINAAWAEAVSFLMALWKNKGKNYRDDEDELTFQSVAGEMVSNMLGSYAGVVTGGEELFELIGKIITGDTWYGIETPGMEQLNDLLDTLIESGSGMRDLVAGGWDVLKNGGNLGDYFSKHSGEMLGGIKDLAKAAAMYLSGIPASNLEAYLTGAMKWISPELGAAYDDLFAETGKSDLAGMEGDALEGRVGRILSDRNVSESDDTAAALAALYEAGYKTAIPSDTPTSVSIDGEKHSLGEYQQQAYDTIWGGIVADALDDMVASDSFKEADPKTQAKMLSNLYTYAAEQAKAELFDEYELTSGARGITEALSEGLSLADCISLKTKTSGVDMYLEMREAGVTSDDAYELVTALSELEPITGTDRVTDIQKWRECVNFSSNEVTQLAALAGVMTEPQYAKVDIAYDYAVSPAVYVTLRETLAKYDTNGNGSLSNSEVTDAINSLRGLSRKQKAVLWQLSVSSKSAKNNPYSPEVGEQVLEALNIE